MSVDRSLIKACMRYDLKFSKFSKNFEKSIETDKDICYNVLNKNEEKYQFKEIDNAV